jgi:hypothetical protein
VSIGATAPGIIQTELNLNVAISARPHANISVSDFSICSLHGMKFQREIWPEPESRPGLWYRIW